MKLLALRQTKTKTSPLFWSTLHGFRYAVDSPQTITMILLLEKRAIKCAPRSKLAREQPNCHANAIKWCRPWGRPVWSMDIWKDFCPKEKRHTPISWRPKTLLWVTKESEWKWILFWKKREMLNGKRNTGERNLNLSACVSQMKTTSILNPSWVLWTPPK